MRLEWVFNISTEWYPKQPQSIFGVTSRVRGWTQAYIEHSPKVSWTFFFLANCKVKTKKTYRKTKLNFQLHILIWPVIRVCDKSMQFWALLKYPGPGLIWKVGPGCLCRFFRRFLAPKILKVIYIYFFFWIFFLNLFI